MSNKELLHNFSTTEYTENTERSCFSLCPLCTLWFFTYQKRIKSLLNGLTDSPQSTQRTQSSAIPVTPYEKAAASRFRTRMTRIFTDMRAYVFDYFPSDQQTHSYLNLLENKPQIMAPRVMPLEGVSTYAPQGIRVRGVEKPQGFGIDERRLIDSASEYISLYLKTFNSRSNYS